MTLGEIGALRAALWDHRFRLVPLLSHTDPDPKRAGKSPVGKHWIEDALRNPPRAAVEPAMAHLANTGILTGSGGPAAVDVDIDDPMRAEAVEEMILQHLSAGLIRRRGNSARIAVVFGSDADDAPRGRVLKSALGRIEVLTDRHQLASYGVHASGVPLLWPLAGPLDVPLGHLPKISAAQVGRLFAALAPVIGAAVPVVRVSHAQAGAECASADLALIASALAAIPVEGAGYEDWIKIGAALWHATSGSVEGLALWDGWSARSGFYDAAGLRRRWHSFAGPRSGVQAGARTLLWLARRCGWRPPAPAPDAAWEAAHPLVGEVPSAPALVGVP